MKRLQLLSILIFGIGIFFVVQSFPISIRVFADDCSENSECKNLQQQINDLDRDLKSSMNATSNLESQVSNMNKKITSIQAGITKAKQEVDVLGRSIGEREDRLANQYVIFQGRVREYYKRLMSFSPLHILLSTSSASNLTKQFAYWQSVQQQDQQIIHGIGGDILQLEKDKKEMEAEQIRLAGLQKQLDTQIAFFKKEIAGAKKYQQDLQGKIAALSARQQSILSEKSGTFQTTVGDVPLTDDANASPSYNPGFSPAFAVFSFGAPHFKGLSQYGAYGRAKEGQSAETILHAYYGGGIEIKKDYENKQIHVRGCSLPPRPEHSDTPTECGTVLGVWIDERIELEQYIKRIYEVPNPWGDNGGMEALKAQAVAARSYALARTNNGAGEICPSENCQVYKRSDKGGNWDKAANDTKGWALIANGKPFSAWYASTSGGYQEAYTSNGYTTPGFWDTKNGRDGWTSQAYEKIAGSPWFYKAWYRSRGGDSCGRSHPWLNQEEMADILNAWRVLQQSGDSRVSPLGGCWGGSPYSLSEMKDKANGAGGAVTSVSNVRVEYSNGGVTSSVKFSTNLGDLSLSGADFKKVFNLRAPGRISVKSGLFNVEKR